MKIAAVLPHWQDVPADAFIAEYSRTTMVGVNLDQRSADQLRTCILPWKGAPSEELAWAGKLGDSIYTKGRQVLWSVPFPGAGQLEVVVAGDHDDLYIAIAYELRRIAKRHRWITQIYVRPPWEMQLHGNIENKALDKAGRPNAKLCKAAWRRIAGIFRAVFRDNNPAVLLIWSPSVERQEVVPWKEVWPGVDFCDIVAPDLYLCKKFGHTPGVYTQNWFREPLLALRAWAFEKGKLFGLSEFGADDDEMAADVRLAISDVKASPSGWAFISWWNDYQQVDCRVDNGRLTAIGAEVGTI